MIKEAETWHVCLIEYKNNALYTGATGNIKKRFKKHKNGCGARYISNIAPGHSV